MHEAFIITILLSSSTIIQCGVLFIIHMSLRLVFTEYILVSTLYIQGVSKKTFLITFIIKSKVIILVQHNLAYPFYGIFRMESIFTAI